MGVTTTITALPAAPARTMTPATFVTTADAFVAALATMVTQINAVGAEITNTVATMTDGLHTMWVPAAAMTSRATNGAGIGLNEMVANLNCFPSLNFDSATVEYAQFAIRMPKSWNEGTVTASFIWSHGSTATNFGVAFGLQGVAISNNESIDTAFGTAVYVVDTGGTLNQLYISDATAAITIGGTPQAEDYVMFQVQRNVANAGDTMAIDAKLHGISIKYTTNAGTDI